LSNYFDLLLTMSTTQIIKLSNTGLRGHKLKIYYKPNVKFLLDIRQFLSRVILTRDIDIANLSVSLSVHPLRSGIV